jgi:membrane protein
MSTDTKRQAPPEEPAPQDLPRPKWKDVAKDVVSEAKEHAITDDAAALTYYATLALFPAVLATVALLGVVGEAERTTQTVLELVSGVAPAEVVDTVRTPVENLAASQNAGAVLSFGFLAAVWSASGYVGAFGRSMNEILEVEETRKFVKLRGTYLVVTIVGLLLAALVALSLVVSGPIAEQVGSFIGLGDTAVTVWDIVKIPLVLVAVVLGIAGLYWAVPNASTPKFRWLTFGSAFAVLVWLLASLAFALYVANFGNYNRTYGSLAGIIVFLIWGWLTNLALLLGAQLDASIERVRQRMAGVPAEEAPRLPTRD